MSQGKKVAISKNTLQDLYCVRKVSMTRIASMLSVCPATILKYLRCYDIKSRTPGEALQTNLANKRIGSWLVTDEKVYLGSKHLRWKCKCLECGNHHNVLARSLYSGTSKQCNDCRRRRHRKGFEELNGTHWAKIVEGARTRNLPFEITIQYAVHVFEKQKAVCALSGRPIRFGYKTTATASLDRTDNRHGYIVGNIQWVHKDFNRMKWKHGHGEFIAMCKEVAAYHASFPLTVKGNQ